LKLVSQTLAPGLRESLRNARLRSTEKREPSRVDGTVDLDSQKAGNKLRAHGESLTSFRQKTLTHGEIIDGSTMRPSLH
jgi:hypothetical protein